MNGYQQLLAICIYGCAYTGCEHELQEYTLPTAVKKASRWTAEEIAFIKETLTEPLKDVALVLDRTYYGTALARSKVQRGLLK